MAQKKTKKTKKARKEKKKLEETPSSSFSRESLGLLVLGLTLFYLLSLLSFVDGDGGQNTFGLVGYALAWCSLYSFGLSAYLLIFPLIWIGFSWLCDRELWPVWRALPTFIASLVSFGLLAMLYAEHFSEHFAEVIGEHVYTRVIDPHEPFWAQKLRYYGGGVPLYYLYRELEPYSLRQALNDWGIFLLATTTFLASLLQFSGLSLRGVLQRFSQRFRFQWEWKWWHSDGETQLVKLRKSQGDTGKEELLPIQPKKDLKVRPSVSAKGPSLQTPSVEPEVPSSLPAVLKEKPLVSSSHYAMPSSQLLSTPKKVDQSALKKDLKRQAEVLQETLQSFGIEAKVGQINCGPTITLFEVHPAIGVKVQKIRALEHDIALNMEAKSIRIIAPIPGKAAVGIEVPNPFPQEVSFRELLATYKQDKRILELPLLLGKTVNGENVIADLCKMPHLIIAGATGSGKSVCINTIVMSLLMNATPEQVKLLMVDPKKVELTAYSQLPHMLAPVITEPQGASAALNWLVKEMERRYDLLKAVGVRNIRSFNKRKRDLAFEDSLPFDMPEQLPYIVGIIDELADLMMVSSSDIETPIARIAQMARAVGIHMILATQRPSREVITGIIKANFPTRISFKVSSRVNSQIVLDETGAETLLGNGDMLFLPPGSHTLVRAQGAFIRDEDITATIDHICSQAPPNYSIASFDTLGTLDSPSEEERDDLYSKAVQIVQEAGSASTSFLQRKLKIGYSRAASLIDQMEDGGVIGPAEGAKPRRVLTNNETPAK